MQSELLRAYQSTDYWVLLTPPLCVRIGVVPTELIKRYCNAQSFTIITAYNPRSKQHSAADNDAANQRLLRQLEQLSLPAKPLAISKAVDPEGQWPDEYGYLVADLTEPQALTLASRYQQNAIVYLAEPEFIPAIVKTD